MKTVVRIAIDEATRRIEALIDTPQTKGVFKRRFQEGRIQTLELVGVLERVEQAVREGLGESSSRRRGDKRPASAMDAALTRGYVMAVALFAHNEASMTPTRALAAAGLSREMAIEAGVFKHDIDALEGHWPEERRNV